MGPAGGGLLDKLPDELVLLLYKELPPQSIGRGDFHALCQRTRSLGNSIVIKARVQDWSRAALMGATFPQLEKLVVEASSRAHLAGARAFLQHSAPQLTRLVSLEIGRMDLASRVLMQQLCSSMPRLQRLSIGTNRARVPVPEAQQSMLEVIRCISQLDQLTALTLKVRGLTVAAVDIASRYYCETFESFVCCCNCFLAPARLLLHTRMHHPVHLELTKNGLRMILVSVVTSWFLGKIG